GASASERLQARWHDQQALAIPSESEQRQLATLTRAQEEKLASERAGGRVVRHLAEVCRLEDMNALVRRDREQRAAIEVTRTVCLPLEEGDRRRSVHVDRAQPAKVAGGDEHLVAGTQQ